jgi:hypothetical protein
MHGKERTSWRERPEWLKKRVKWFSRFVAHSASCGVSFFFAQIATGPAGKWHGTAFLGYRQEGLSQGTEDPRAFRSDRGMPGVARLWPVGLLSLSAELRTTPGTFFCTSFWLQISVTRKVKGRRVAPLVSFWPQRRKRRQERSPDVCPPSLVV